ncbi:MAG: hypothetical protein AAFX87_03300 [Bacteroidota bacterium]
MKAYIINLILVVFVSTQVKAQDKLLKSIKPIKILVEGYVVSNSGDTLRGKVACLRVAGYVQTISLRDGQGKSKFSASEVLGFTQKRPVLLKDFSDLTTVDQNWVYYESHPHPKKKGQVVFLQRLMDGRIKVYDNPFGAERSSQLSIVQISQKESSYFVKKDGNSLIKLKNKNFDEQLKHLFFDCQRFEGFARDNPKTIKFKKLHYLVEFYNTTCNEKPH